MSSRRSKKTRARYIRLRTRSVADTDKFGWDFLIIIYVYLTSCVVCLLFLLCIKYIHIRLRCIWPIKITFRAEMERVKGKVKNVSRLHPAQISGMRFHMNIIFNRIKRKKIKYFFNTHSSDFSEMLSSRSFFCVELQIFPILYCTVSIHTHTHPS